MVLEPVLFPWITDVWLLEHDTEVLLYLGFPPEKRANPIRLV